MLREVAQLGFHFDGAMLDCLRRLGVSRECHDARRVRKVRHLPAQGLEAVLGVHAFDHLAMQLRLTVELKERERGEGADHDRSDREPRGRQASRGRDHGVQAARAAAKEARAAASVASMSAGPCALDTNPASYADGAR